MVVTRVATLFTNPIRLGQMSVHPQKVLQRGKTKTATGAFLPEPPTIPFGLVGIVCAVIPGLLIGAAISKTIANFLEENDLFVPSEDDEDD